ncbi:uncharacterized protein J3R85_004490 [Psidium guajava]|nr:uncharacterized protein J3R85_004490 [Psidium guajava]
MPRLSWTAMFWASSGILTFGRIGGLMIHLALFGRVDDLEVRVEDKRMD